MQQLSLVFEPGLTTRSSSLRQHVASRMYAYGLDKVAPLIDCSPSHLTEKVAGVDSSGRKRHISLDDLERYMQTTGDVSAVYYLVERYLRDPELQRLEAAARLTQILETLPGLLEAAGVAPKAKAARR